MDADGILAMAYELTAHAARTAEALSGLDFVLDHYPEAAHGRVLVANLLPHLREGIRLGGRMLEILGSGAPAELPTAVSAMRTNLRMAVQLAGPLA